MRSDHFDGKKFFNPNGANGQSFRNVPRLLRTPRTPWPKRVEVVQQKPPTLSSDEAAVVTFIGHSTFLIQTAAANIITDPVYATSRVGPFGIAGPRRTRDPGVAFNDLPRIDVVLLSHNHYDHCDLRTLRAIERKFSPIFVTPLGNGRILRRSAGARRIEELDWWESSRTAPLPITVTQAQHFSARTPWDRNRALWGGFVIDVNGKRIYYAGDTGYGPHFREVHARLGAMSMSLIPIGAYEPRWFMKDIHMNPEEAVQAHIEVESALSIACHFGTFQLTPEGIDEPVVKLGEALRTANISADLFRVIEVGDSVRLA